MKEKKVFLEITGMTCDHCAEAIERLFEKKNGIVSQKVSYQNGKGEFIYHPEDISKDAIIGTINQTKRYRAKEVNNTEAPGLNTGHFDLIIIGGGSAAFSAAIKAESLGLTTLMGSRPNVVFTQIL